MGRIEAEEEEEDEKEAGEVYNTQNVESCNKSEWEGERNQVESSTKCLNTTRDLISNAKGYCWIFKETTLGKVENQV